MLLDQRIVNQPWIDPLMLKEYLHPPIRLVLHRIQVSLSKSTLSGRTTEEILQRPAAKLECVPKHR